MKKKRKRKITVRAAKSAKTGRFIKAKEAESHPSTTFIQRIVRRVMRRK